MKEVYSVLCFIVVHCRNFYHRLVLFLSIVFSELYSSSHVFQMVLINTCTIPNKPHHALWLGSNFLSGCCPKLTFSQVYHSKRQISRWIIFPSLVFHSVQLLSISFILATWKSFVKPLQWISNQISEWKDFFAKYSTVYCGITEVVSLLFLWSWTC